MFYVLASGKMTTLFGTYTFGMNSKDTQVFSICLSSLNSMVESSCYPIVLDMHTVSAYSEEL